jgi:hypothetical protein
VELTSDCVCLFSREHAQKPPVFDLTLSQESKKVERNPKGKAKAEVPLSGTTRHNSAATGQAVMLDGNFAQTHAFCDQMIGYGWIFMSQ